VKIEKLNDSQIRCTLNAEDLKEKQLGITDIAFCSEKAKSLFRDMMKCAARDFGFSFANSSSLMVELRATSPDDLVLTITKLGGPDDMKKFLSNAAGATGYGNLGPVGGIAGIAGIGAGPFSPEIMAKGGNNAYMEKYKSLFEKALTAPEQQTGEQPAGVRSFRFDSLDDVIAAAKAVGKDYIGRNSLYRFGNGNNFQLLLQYDPERKEAFEEACGTISEYALALTCTDATENYLKEHGGLIVEGCAIQKLARL